jgi:hypothetical protein
MKNLALIFIVHVVQDAIVILIAIVIVVVIAQKKNLLYRLLLYLQLPSF